jgi:hypothetical protein
VGEGRGLDGESTIEHHSWWWGLEIGGNGCGCLNVRETGSITFTAFGLLVLAMPRMWLSLGFAGFEVIGTVVDVVGFRSVLPFDVHVRCPDGHSHLVWRRVG